jgi:hypothetical protein
MNCEVCDRLLAAYTAAVRLYTATVVTIQGLTGNNRLLASQEEERLKLVCHLADNALMTHLGQDHGNPTPEADSSVQ